MLPQGKDGAPGRGEDTGVFQRFFPLQNLISQNPPDKFSAFPRERMLWLKLKKNKKIINL